MKRTATLLILLACSLAATADPIKGAVRNMTTNKPSVGDEITLKKIGNGMEDVGKTKTNAKGEFSFNVPPMEQPYIVWIQHQGVTYTQRAVPGGPPVAVRVFDAAAEIKEVNLVEHAIIFNGGDKPDTLTGEEIFTVANTSNPPRTLMSEHTLEFYLPEGVSITESSVRFGNVPEIKTAVIPQGEKNKYAFKFPIRPGQTQFHIAYTLPYSGNLKIDPKSGAVQSLIIVAPETMKFTPADKSLYKVNNNAQFKGVNFYVAKNVGLQQQTGFEIAGSGVLPRESEQASGGASGEAGNRPGGGLGVPNAMPDPMQSGQWLFLGVLSLFLTAGAVFVFTSNQKPVPVTGKAGKSQDRAGVLLEAMKEEVFQLESDRLQGKISPQDYQTAKTALDKTLQRAVQRQSTGKAK